MQKNTPQDSLLGKESDYPSTYAPELLFAIPRSNGRAELGIDDSLPFYGVDRWTAYELSWLNGKGKPQVAMAEFVVPCDSPCLIESKSLKLYLNSLNQSKYSEKQEVERLIGSDLSSCAGGDVTVNMSALRDKAGEFCNVSEYLCIDDLDVEINQYQPDSSQLGVDTQSQVSERLVSHLLKSNCPVTGQPDWASLFIDYSGARIDHAGLLRYLISYREHMGFHEQCIEQIFMDIMRECAPLELTVNARYLRRGGLDINPVRSTQKDFQVIGRQVRQ